MAKVNTIDPYHAMQARHVGERGFSLLEVLIALLVLSFGLLGIAGLQTFSLQFNHQSYERTQATLLISDMAERITANPLGATAGGYDGVAPGTMASGYSGYGGCPSNCATTSELATYDLFLWKSAMENPKILAQGTGSITRQIDATDAAALIFDISIQWVENNLPMSQTMRIRTL
jgi:type IV pilus assembly protein PilV